MNSKIILICIAFLSLATYSQTKTGTVDSEYIMSIMPETKIVVKRSKDYGAKLDSSFNIKVNEYKVKLEYFKKNEKTLGELAKKTSITELQTLEADLNKYRENGRKLLQLRQEQLMRPLYQKITKGIEDVSKENGYTQILTITGNQFGYADPKFDITDLVIKKLGITVPVTPKK
jgi:outer membrane protein